MTIVNRTMSKYSKAWALMFVFVLALAALPGAFAQSTGPSEVMFHWGAIHYAPGQALAINFVVPDAPDLGDPTRFAVELRLADKNGNVVYENKAEGASGHDISFVIASDARAAKTITGDIYGVVDPNERLLLPSLRVVPLSELEPLPAAQRMIPTLEVMEVLTGRVLGFANAPRAIVPDAPDRTE